MTHPDKEHVTLRQDHDYTSVDQSIHGTHDEAMSRAAPDQGVQTQTWPAEGEHACGLPGLPIDEWSFFRHAHPHTLLVGSAARATAAVARLRRDLRTPLVHWHPSAVAEPPQTAGTLIIWEVDTLDRTQQERFLMWMDLQVDLQVISVARYPVFPLVLEGAFLDTLYYRLNTVCLQLSDSRVLQSVPDRCEARDANGLPRPVSPSPVFLESHYEND